MASPTFKPTGVVLKKTRLGESDMIVEFLLVSGSRLKAVAKGARKPTGRFSSHLELFNTVEMLCVKGKNLDIVKESKLLASRQALHADPVRNAAASSVAELMEGVTQAGLPQSRIYDLTNAALDHLESATDAGCALIVAADILKTFAFIGVRPTLMECVACGTEVIGADDVDASAPLEPARARDVRFSYMEGGVLCADCAANLETIWVPRSAAVLAQRLLMSTFKDIERMQVADDIAFELLQMLQMWVGVHAGMRLRSLSIFIDLVFVRSN